MPTRDVTALSLFIAYILYRCRWLDNIIVLIAMATHSYTALLLFTVGFVLTIDVSFHDKRFFIQGEIRRPTEKPWKDSNQVRDVYEISLP